MPKYMVFVKATDAIEEGQMPSEAELSEMGSFNEELVKAGVMLGGDGLHPSSTGARIQFDGDERTVVDGPFAETKELIAGYWILQGKSREEIVEWMKRSPFRDGEVEIRQVFEPEDFGAEYTPELRERDERLRAEAERNA
jgi:hypothetical protein